MCHEVWVPVSRIPSLVGDDVFPSSCGVQSSEQVTWLCLRRGGRQILSEGGVESAPYPTICPSWVPKLPPGFFPLTPVPCPLAVWQSGYAQQDGRGGLCRDAEAQGWRPPEGAVPPRGFCQGQGPAWRQLLYQVPVAMGARGGAFDEDYFS